MTLTSKQLEWIVQEVVRRLVAISSKTTSKTSSDTSSAAQTSSGSELIVEQRLVTTHTLANRLEGVSLVRLPNRAVITPAAKDLLRDHGIELTFAT